MYVTQWRSSSLLRPRAEQFSATFENSEQKVVWYSPEDNGCGNSSDRKWKPMLEDAWWTAKLIVDKRASQVRMLQGDGPSSGT
ncbi:hypothetical protein IAQ61_006698 [Plenodomus lingam]|uniref:uncharacterized protein n=1 Tax=Leptosphaeria maculans TaxID=5022 RepID=UPI003317E9DF|nr:hypothetical protein IAQ61_006698 [Plenodomus lingam]